MRKVSDDLRTTQRNEQLRLELIQHSVENHAVDFGDSPKGDIESSPHVGKSVKGWSAMAAGQYTSEFGPENARSNAHSPRDTKETYMPRDASEGLP